MTAQYKAGIGQIILNEMADFDDSFVDMSIWGDAVTKTFSDLGICSLDLYYVFQGMEDAYGFTFPDNTLDIVSNPLDLLTLIVQLLNERSTL